MEKDQEKNLEFVLNMIYGYENLFHFLEAVRFTKKSADVLSNIF